MAPSLDAFTALNPWAQWGITTAAFTAVMYAADWMAGSIKLWRLS